MKSVPPILLILLFALSCDSSGPGNSANVFGDNVPDPDAVAEGPVESDLALDIVLGLARSQDSLAERVDELHDPGSPHYHDFRSVSEIAEEFGADDSTIKTVQEYLDGLGISLTADATKGFLHG